MFSNVIMANQENVVKSFMNVRDMLKYRNIDVSSLDGFGEEEILSLAGSQSVFTICVNPELYLVFYMVKMKVSEFNNAMFGKQKDLSPDIARANMDKKYIFIFREDPNTANKTHINEYFPKNEVFNMRCTLICPHLHAYVPPHRKLSEEEAQEVLKKHHIENKSQLPCILSGDPMAKFIGLVPGEIVEITRSSPTAGTHLYYRICV